MCVGLEGPVVPSEKVCGSLENQELLALGAQVSWSRKTSDSWTFGGSTHSEAVSGGVHILDVMII